MRAADEQRIREQNVSAVRKESDEMGVVDLVNGWSHVK